MTKRYMCAVLFFFYFLATDAFSAVNEDIVMFVETPAPNQVMTGVSFIRGWAVAPIGIANVEFYIDGVFQLNIPLGESRPDVGDLFPTFPGSDTSGFNIAFFYAKFGNGAHTATVRALDTNGDEMAVDVPFFITRFDTTSNNNFLRDLSKIDLSGAAVSKVGNAIEINGALIDGVSYDVRLDFNVTLQGFAVSDISPSQGMPVAFPFDGTWSGSAQPTTATDLDGFECDPAITFTMSIVNHQITGTANTTFSGVFQLDGTVADNGQVSVGLAVNNQDAASFEGVFAGNSASGTYDEIFGCRGTWSASRN